MKKYLLILKHNTFIVSLILGVMLSIIIEPFVSFASTCEDLQNDTLRLHVVANSDSEKDQKVKLKVRDEILKYYSSSLKEKTKTNAIMSAENLNRELTDVAQKTLVKNGFNYGAKVYVTKMYFPTTKYEDFTMPAGEYDALRVELGTAKGKNWWCVLFPPLCLSACSDDSFELLTDEEKELIQGEYDIRFASVELVENILEKIKN